MKFLDGTILGAGIDAEEEKEIMDLIEKSSPSTNSNLSFINIKERVGWVCITVKNDTSEFLIKYSSCMFDTSCLVRFFEKLISLKEKTVLVLDNEGSLPILYAEPIDNNNVRFIFAHDYNLFLNQTYSPRSHDQKT